MKKLPCWFLALFLYATPCDAVLVGLEKRKCPVCDETIEVLEYASFGSYIYYQESKYDLIFFPDTYPEFIWFCSKCGYAQSFRYFSDLKKKEKEAVKQFLAVRWEPKSPNDISPEMRLDQAVLINKFLCKDDNFWAGFNRVLIYNYRKLDPEKARAYTKNEIELLEKKKGDLEDEDKARPYLLGEYNRVLGNLDIARTYFVTAQKADLAFDGKIVLVACIILSLGALVCLVVLWVIKRLGLKLRIMATGFLALVILLCSFGAYWSPAVMLELKNRNDYYNDIIDERLALLDNAAGSLPYSGSNVIQAEANSFHD